MDLTGDDLAGVVDLFGGLTRGELTSAVEELAFKRGVEYDPAVAATAVDAAVDSYHLVVVGEQPAVLVAGPAAFPSLPDGAGDLPHILDVPDRSVADADAVSAARDALEADAVAAVDAGDEQRAAHLVDVSYDLEAWGSVDAGPLREILDRV